MKKIKIGFKKKKASLLSKKKQDKTEAAESQAASSPPGTPTSGEPSSVSSNRIQSGEAEKAKQRGRGKSSSVLELVDDSRLRVAIIGRPNVGKSTLFNKLIGKSVAITDNQPGVTRDYQENVAELLGMQFTVIDTPGAENVEKILVQTQDALRTADLAIFMTDAKSGTTDLDLKIASWTYTKNMPVLHVVNKIDLVSSGLSEVDKTIGVSFMVQSKAPSYFLL